MRIDVLKLASHALFVAAVTAVFVGWSGVASAGPNDGFAVPELSPGSAGGALTLLTGGLVLLRERFRTAR